ncbi:hypothetical protein B296_00023815 [Ensete ventricosum]|uniref:Transmembrane protein n=1 Tax=Ensete ventricosum TaxID=4639 RepID=A0A426ZR03_ENSVE|nr:hypothetical protein B296_00023815 [Ensete ventricosum]
MRNARYQEEPPKSTVSGRLREKEEEGEEEKGEKREILALPWFPVQSVARRRFFANELPSPRTGRQREEKGTRRRENKATPCLTAQERGNTSSPRAGRRENKVKCCVVLLCRCVCVVLLCCVLCVVCCCVLCCCIRR